ncbi:hypothetical protein DB32_008067 [Sandaracinus amylolyticus]|uniref:Uncharacterized protein n=1 Tax=Sandaracinus amylolyticus TaxID=927083 RepID=A0A0F6W9J6_9BACT|nr:hypothetical protein DB32_008067 [Sandaracinus amylolyticus]
MPGEPERIFVHRSRTLEREHDERQRSSGDPMGAIERVDGPGDFRKKTRFASLTE